MKKELKFGFISADKSADCRPRPGYCNRGFTVKGPTYNIRSIYVMLYKISTLLINSKTTCHITARFKSYLVRNLKDISYKEAINKQCSDLYRLKQVYSYHKGILKEKPVDYLAFPW